MRDDFILSEAKNGPMKEYFDFVLSLCAYNLKGQFRKTIASSSWP